MISRYEWAWKKKTGSMTSKMALLQIAASTGSGMSDSCSGIGVNEMAARCEMSPRAFRNAIKSLEKAGLITLTYLPGKPTTYTIKTKNS